MWECIREARSHSLSFFRSTLTLALLLVFTLQMEREREQKIVFQMFTSQEVAVGLTSKVLKEIRKLEKQKFTFNKRRERERLACLHTLHWNPTLASEASLFMEGIADFSFCFSYLLVCSLLHSPAMNTGFTEHSHILGDSSSSFWVFLLSFCLHLFLVFFLPSTALHVKARYYMHVCVWVWQKKWKFSLFIYMSMAWAWITVNQCWYMVEMWHETHCSRLLFCHSFAFPASIFNFPNHNK